jgi:hypothetical protein
VKNTHAARHYDVLGVKLVVESVSVHHGAHDGRDQQQVVVLFELQAFDLVLRLPDLQPVLVYSANAESVVN